MSEKKEFTIDHAYKVIQALNKITHFPVKYTELEKLAGLKFEDYFKISSHMSLYNDFSFRMSGSVSSTDQKEILIDFVEVKADITRVPLPEKSQNSILFDVTYYAYLPTNHFVEALPEGFYRSLKHIDVEKHKEVNGHELSRGSEWEYRINKERGPFVSEKEKASRKKTVLELLSAIKEDRFEAQYEKFQKEFMKTSMGSHDLYGYSVTIRYFNDRSEKYKSDFLKEEGNVEYIGIHVYNEQGSDSKYPHPYLFDFFNINEIDARMHYIGTPYNPVDPNNPGSHPQAGLDNPLPDISAAGHRKGGWAYYMNLEHRKEGWTFECPGIYPHDGKTVAKMLNKDILKFGNYTVTYTRKKGTA